MSTAMATGTTIVDDDAHGTSTLAQTTIQAIISSTTTTAAPTMAAVSFTTTTTSPTTTTTTTGSPEKLSVSDLSHTLQHFGIVDYLVFIAMLAVCAVIGFYFGFIEKKQKRQKQQLGQQELPTDEKDGEGDGAGAAGHAERRGSEALDYLVGGRKMKVFPVALSLVAR